MVSFDLTKERIYQARGIAWDQCHKIYILMDDEQVDKMRVYQYDPLITADEMTPEEMLNTVKDWWDRSCGLRFINAVHPHDGFETIIGQFDDEEEDEEVYA